MSCRTARPINQLKNGTVDVTSTVLSITSIRAKIRADGVIYNGALHPNALPAIPLSRFAEDGKIIIDTENTAGIVMKRYLVHQELSYEEYFQRAFMYINSSYSVQCVPQPLCEYIDVARRYPVITTMVMTDAGKEVTRERWLFQGISIARPSEITPDQITQLLTAAYWSHVKNSEYKIVADEIVNFYNDAGYQTILKRPYNKNDAPEISAF